MPEDYYKINIVKEFQPVNNTVNYNTTFSQRNPDYTGKLSLDHIEFIEYMVRLLKPKNFIELGVQFGETTKRIIPHIPDKYIGVDVEKSENIKYFTDNYTNFEFNQMKTDDYFELNKNRNLGFEMGFIDACHTHEASYKDFLNLKEHIVPDGIIFFHDTYPYSKYWTDYGLSGDAYLTAEKIRKEHNHEFEIITLPVNPGLSMARKIVKQLYWL